MSGDRSAIAAELRARADELDGADPLAEWREEFEIADPDLVYLDGNSLGMMPRRTPAALRHVLETEWATELIASWDHWVDLPTSVGDTLAPLIGARSGEVIVHDSVSINLYQLIHAAIALHPERDVIAVDADDFPTDRYIVEGIAAATGRSVCWDPTTIETTVGWERVAVSVRSLVDYRTAEIADLATETARARESGALVIWDLSHAAGVIEVDLHGAGADLAVGCTYKFLNGGPGAPGFSYVATPLIERIDQPIRGWWSQHQMFDMALRYEPRPDIGRLLIGSIGVLGMTAAQMGIEVVAEAGITAIADKARRLTGFGLQCCDALGLHSPSPRDERWRGGHFSVQHPRAEEINRRLAADHRVIADFRQPDVIRLGCSPLTTRYRDVSTACAAIAGYTAA